MRWIHRNMAGFPVPVDITADRAITDLREGGAVRWANLLFPIEPDEAPGLHAFGSALAERVPEMTPFGGVHVEDEDPLGVAQEAIEHYGMAGLKFHPMVQRFEPWDERLEPVIEYLERKGKPLYVHTGYDEFYGYDLDRSGLEGMLSDHPELPVVLPHIGFPDLDWGFRLADRFSQVWLDLTNVPGSFGFFGVEDEDSLRQFLVDNVGRLKDRVLVGTDYPVGMGSLEEIVTQYEHLGFSETLLEHVMVTTTKSFFDRYGRPRP